jgi:hypothetical protein
VNEDQIPDPLIEPDPGVSYDVEKMVEESIRAYDRESEGGNALLIGWVVVAEWIDENGDPAISAFAREGMPYWRIDGLMAAAPEALMYVDYEDE